MPGHISAQIMLGTKGQKKKWKEATEKELNSLIQYLPSVADHNEYSHT